MRFIAFKKIAIIAILMPILYSLGERQLSAPESAYKLTKDPRKVIILDPGHGMSNKEYGKMDWGGARYKDYREANITLQQAEYIKKTLNPSLYRVILTREDNYKSTPLESRPKLANSINADMFISLHLNNLKGRKNLHGFEVYYRKDKNKEFAKIAAKNLEEITLLPKRCIKRNNYLMLKGLECPAILVEGGYLPGDKNTILDSTKSIEKAVIKTIEDYFGN